MISDLRMAASKAVIAIGILAAVDGFAAGLAGAQESHDGTSRGGTSSNANSQDRFRCEDRQRALAPDIRIDACTALIESGDLTRTDLAISRNDRGTAYQEKHDLDRALADFNEAIKINPDFALAFVYHGDASLTKGDLNRAIADYGEAIALDPR